MPPSAGIGNRKYVADFRYPHVVERDFGILALLSSRQGELDDRAHADKRAQGRLGPEQLVSSRRLSRAISRAHIQEQADRRRPASLVAGNPRNDAGGCLEDADHFLSIVRGKVDVLLFGTPPPMAFSSRTSHPTRCSYRSPSSIARTPSTGRSPETPVGGPARFTTAAQGHDGRTMVFYIGLDSRVDRKARSPADGGFTNEEAIGDGASQLCVAQNLDGTLEVVYVGNDACLYGVKQLAPDGAWGKPGPIDGRSMTGPPGAIPYAAQVICAARNTDGSLEVFYVGDGLNLFHIRQNQRQRPFWQRLAAGRAHDHSSGWAEHRRAPGAVLGRARQAHLPSMAGDGGRGLVRAAAPGGARRDHLRRAERAGSARDRRRRHELLSLPQSPG